jgi:hypothetical protein
MPKVRHGRHTEHTLRLLELELVAAERVKDELDMAKVLHQGGTVN